MEGDRVPDSKAPTMRGNPFLDFHRTAEAAGYPALLIASVFSLALVVVPILLLGLTRAVWVLALALLGLIAAVAILAGALDAALSDYDDPAAGRPDVGAARADEGEQTAALARHQPTTGQAGQDRKAA
jgi:hypothetical protein